MYFSAYCPKIIPTGFRMALSYNAKWVRVSAIDMHHPAEFFASNQQQ
jgi:hypothetical protein